MSNNIAYAMTFRCQIPNSPGALGQLATVIGAAGGNIGAIDIVKANRHHMVRDITINVQGEAHGEQIVNVLNSLPGVVVLQYSDRVFLAHLGGKLEVASKVPLKTRDDLSLAYTPGVARVCQAIADEPEKAYALTIKRNSVAVVTDGSAVLGMGNIGSAAAMPVMEGKAILFKELANIDAYPVLLKSQEPDVIVDTIEQISMGFGAINLEDIAAPQCFDIERRLNERIDIAVMHDDQHGTAVAVMAALINALKWVNKRIEDVRVVVNGVGAAGTAIIHILLSAGVGEITACDRHGILWEGDTSNMTGAQADVARMTNQGGRQGELATALVDADVFIGVSVGNILSRAMVRTMVDEPIVFMMANPIPEGNPNELYDVAAVVGTGRSDFPNQINNVLTFPGIFRGVLDVNASAITANMHLAAANAIAGLISEEELNGEYVIPGVFNRELVPSVAEAVGNAAKADGVARRG